MPLPDLHSTRDRLRQGLTTATDELGVARAAAAQPHVFLHTRFEAAAAEAGASSPDTPLAGLAVSIKDLFDCAGEPTRAGSTALSDAAPAAGDPPSGARPRPAGRGGAGPPQN